MNPTLKEHLQWTKWGDHFLLFNPDNRSTLRIQDGDRGWIETMDGSLTLAELEYTVPSSAHLLEHLERLCRGEFLENSDEIFSFLFPNQKRSQWNHRHSRFLYGPLFERSMNWPLTLPSPTLLFLLCIALFIGGLGWMISSQHNFAIHPWAIGHDWLLGSLAAYGVNSIVLSVIGIVQMSLVRPFSQSVPFQIRHLFGIIHIGTARHMLFHTPVYIQRQYSGLGLGMTLGSVGLCFMGEAMTGTGTGASLANALMLLLLWQCCPFYDTDGAQLFETVSVHKQRLRTQDFLKSSALRSPFGDVQGQRELRWVLTVWLVWFGVAIHMLGQSVVPYLSTLLIQSLQQPTIFGMIWLGLVFAAIVVYYAYFGVQGLQLSGALLQQILPQRIKVSKSDVSDDWIARHAQTLQEIGIESLPKNTQIISVSDHARLDTRMTEPGLWLVIHGDVALVDPKPEGGHETLLHFPTPCVLQNSEILQEPLKLWGLTETELLCIPSSDLTSHTHQVLKILNTQPSFALLSTKWQWLLAVHARHQICNAGSILLAKNDPTDAIYIVESGTFQVLQTDIELKVHSIIGEMGILSEEPRSATIQCTSSGRVLMIPAYLIRLCIQQCPDFANNLHTLMIERQEGTV